MGLDLLRQPAAPPLLLIAATATPPELLPSDFVVYPPMVLSTCGGTL